MGSSGCGDGPNIVTRRGPGPENGAHPAFHQLGLGCSELCLYTPLRLWLGRWPLLSGCVLGVSDDSSARASSSRMARGSSHLFEEMQDELRGIACAIFAEQDRSHTLQPTALINEAWLKLAGRLDDVSDRPHFFALVARVMRQVLTDHARAKRAGKRGGANHKITFVDEGFGRSDMAFDVIAFHDALEHLALLNERHAEVVELRLLGLLTVPEISDLLGTSVNTVKRDWRAARAWLVNELRDQ